MGENSGVLCVNKPQGMTSHGVVNRIRRLYNTKRVGHTGTLDPMATGVLVVLIGRAAKAAEYIVSDMKEYDVRFKLGMTTDTGDITGTILSQTDVIPDTAEVIKAAESFKGKIKQLPPMYSAIKINGQKLVDLARKGIEVERETRDVEIFDINIEAESNEYHMYVTCSKGTYIRTLCTDIGEAVNSGAVMTYLERTRNGRFKLNESYTIEDIENMTESSRSEMLLPVEELFADLKSVTLPEFYARLAGNGLEIYQKKIGTNFTDGEYVRLYNENGFFALGKVKEFENGSAIKPEKFFII
jgi:tRNA pseudouridine 55 synthase